MIVDGGATGDLLPEDQHRRTAQDERRSGRGCPARARRPRVRGEPADRQRGFLEAEATRPFVHEHVRPLDGRPGYHLYWFDPSGTLRALAPVRYTIHPLWFDRGLPLTKKVYARLLHRSFPSAGSAVAAAEEAGPWRVRPCPP